MTAESILVPKRVMDSVLLLPPNPSYLKAWSAPVGITTSAVSVTSATLPLTNQAVLENCMSLNFRH